MFGGWDMAKLAVEAAFVVPINILSGRDFYVVDTDPGAAVSNQFCFVERVERLGHGIVITIAFGTHRCDRVTLRKSFSVANCTILGGFNRSMQHRGFELTLTAPQTPRLGFSSSGSWKRPGSKAPF